MKVRVTEGGVVQEIVLLPVNSKRLMLNIKIQKRLRDATRTWKVKNQLVTQVVIMNLIACTKKKQRLFYSRGMTVRAESKYNERGITSRDIIQAVDELEKMGYLRNYIADRQYGNMPDKLPSWITATHLFEEKFCRDDEKVVEAEEMHLSANVNIELRDEKKKPIDYVATEEIAEADRVVYELNRMNKQHTFTNHDGENVVNIYSRVFNETFGHGGRYYKAGVLEIKNKTTKDRLRMQIDGEPVYEVDFDCLHVNILADELGIKSIYEGDIYYKVLDPSQYNLNNRKLVKHSVNICLNAKSVHSAAAAIDEYMNDSPVGAYCFSNGYEVIRAIKEKLHHFKDAFCNKTSSGKRLQNVDSWIAHWVVNEFVNRQIPLLVIHDSFIVRRRDVDLLVSAMSDAYKKVVNVDRVVNMKLNWVEDGIVQQADCSK